jgi:VanZ family protein
VRARRNPTSLPAAAESIVTQRRSTRALLLVALLAAYGSLYPFQFARPPLLAAALWALLRDAHLWTSLGDVAGNVLLFAPLGVAIVFVVNGAAAKIKRYAAYFAGAIAFALLLQIAQIFVPARTAALSDVLWNGVGALLGIAIGITVQTLLRHGTAHGDRYAGVALLIIAFWFGWRLWPFEPLISELQIRHALQPLLVPSAFNTWSFASMAASMMLLAGVVPSLRRPHLWLIGVAALTLMARLFLARQTISTGVLGGAAAGVLLGLGVLQVGVVRGGRLAVVMAMAWYTAESLRPFEFSTQRATMDWLPFTALLRGAMDINLAALCGVAFLSGALMLIGARLHFVPGRWGLALCAWLMLLEFVQLWIPTRTCDFTIALLPLAWWVGLHAIHAPPANGGRPPCSGANPGASCDASQVRT